MHDHSSQLGIQHMGLRQEMSRRPLQTPFVTGKREDMVTFGGRAGGAEKCCAVLDFSRCRYLVRSESSSSAVAGICCCTACAVSTEAAAAWPTAAASARPSIPELSVCPSTEACQLLNKDTRLCAVAPTSKYSRREWFEHCTPLAKKMKSS